MTKLRVLVLSFPDFMDNSNVKKTIEVYSTFLIK
jgi:hypothetical protein